MTIRENSSISGVASVVVTARWPRRCRGLHACEERSTRSSCIVAAGKVAFYQIVLNDHVCACHKGTHGAMYHGKTMLRLQTCRSSHDGPANSAYANPHETPVCKASEYVQPTWQHLTRGTTTMLRSPASLLRVLWHMNESDRLGCGGRNVSPFSRNIDGWKSVVHCRWT